MAKIKKNALANIMFVMVDSTDFASVESGVAGSDITAKLWKVTHGNSTAAASLTPSKTVATVKSGLFQMTLEASETSNMDHGMLVFTNASCAAQFIPLEAVDYDDSDIYSLISNYGSNISAMVSDVDSQLTLTDAAIDSRIPDVLASVVTRVSQIDAGVDTLETRVPSTLTSVVTRISQIDAYAAGISNVVSGISDVLSKMGGPEHIASLVWDADKGSYVDASSMGSVVQAGTATPSAVADKVWSDYQSKVGQTPSQVFSNISNALSVLSDLAGNIDSQLTLTDTTASQILVDIAAIGDKSDIASAVWAEKHRVHSLASSFGSAFSNVWTSADAAASRALLNQSAINNVDSQLTVTDAAIDSRIPDVLTSVVTRISQIDSGCDAMQTSVTVGASGRSDIGSAVWGQKYTAHSAASTFGSLMSDIYSKAGAGGNASDIASKVWAEKYSDYTTASSMGSHMGAINIGGTLTASDISDIASAVWSQDKSNYQSSSSMGSVLQAGTATPSAVADKVWSDYQSKVGVTASKAFSHVSHTLSTVSDLAGNIDSQLTLTDATASQILVDTAALGDKSDIASAVWGEKHRVHSLASSFGSAFSNVWTSADAAASRALLNQSAINNVDSQLTVTDAKVPSLLTSIVTRVSQIDAGVDNLEARLPNNIASAVWDADKGSYVDASSMGSVVQAITASVSASDISDIASAVWAANHRVHSLASSFGSAFSNVWTSADAAASRALLNQSAINNVDSQLTVTDAAIDSRIPDTLTSVVTQINQIDSGVDVLQTRIPSALTSIVTRVSQIDATVSDMSNITSQILGDTVYISGIASDVGSRLSLSNIGSAVWAQKYTAHSAVSTFGSLMSDVYSGVSNVGSRITKEVASKSLLSDVESNIRSQIAGISATLSNTYSAVSDLQSDFQSRVPKEVASKSLLSDVESNVRSQLSDITSVLSNVQSQVGVIKADLPTRITKNTALSNFEFVMIDSTDDITGKTGLTVTATRSIDGAAFGACANSVTEVANGVYKIDLAAGDLNGDVITLQFTATGANARFVTIVTQP